jgi:hypothetical protein
LQKGAPPGDDAPPKDPTGTLEGLIRIAGALQEKAIDLQKIRALDSHLDGQHPIRQPPQPIQFDGAADHLGEDGQPFLGARGARMPGRQERQVGLGLAVEGGGDVDEGLVMQQLGEVAVGKAGASPYLNGPGGGQGIGGEAVHQFDGGRLVAEMGAHRVFEIHRHRLGTVIGRWGRGNLDLVELANGLQDAFRQF